MASSSRSGFSRHPNLKRLEIRKFKEIERRKDLASTADVVRAYNETSDAVEKRLLLCWLEHHVRWFSKQTDVALKPEIIETYTELAGVHCRGPKEETLLKQFLFTLLPRLNEKNFCTYEIMAALEHALNVIDPQFLKKNARDLIDLAPKLFMHLNPSNKKFTKMTFVEDVVTLLALHQILVIYQIVAPDQLSEQIVQDFINITNAIEKSNEYYPYEYYARMIRHSLKALQKHRAFGTWVMLSRRIFYGACASVCLLQGVGAVMQLGFDYDAVMKCCQLFKKAFGGLGRDKWTKEVQEISKIAMMSIKSHDLGQFKERSQLSMEQKKHCCSKDRNKKMLRFCIISTLRMLAIEGPSEEFRWEAMDELLKFASPPPPVGENLRNPDLFEAMLDALHAVYAKGEQAQRASAMLHTLTSITAVKNLKEKADKWIGEGNYLEDVLDIIPKEVDEYDELYAATREEMGFRSSWMEIEENIEMLKGFYKSPHFSQVPSIFDEKIYKHVEHFEYDIVRYEEKEVEMKRGIIGSGEEGNHLKELVQSRQRVPTSISLQGILEPKKVKEGTLHSAKDTKYLLFGNPGTGKTSISKSFAFGWSMGRMGQDFDALYVLRVRELTDGFFGACRRLGMCLATAIANTCFPQRKFSDDAFEDLWKQIEDSLDDMTTLLILDGLDEADSIGETIVQEALERGCHVLFTSRPYNVKNIRSRVRIEMECLGMSDDQLSRFIAREASEGVDVLISHLQSTPSIWKMAHLPITASILCFVWNGRKSTSTITDVIGKSRFKMYCQMANFVWERYSLRFQAGSTIPDRDKIFGTLEEIAFHARGKNEIQISEQLVKEHSTVGGVRAALWDSGFLLFQLEGKTYQFAHLTFQEFFAGCSLAMSLFAPGRPDKKALEFIAKNKYREVQWDTFSFMMQKAVHDHGDEAFEKIMAILDQEPLDRLGILHKLLMLRMVDAFVAVREDLNERCPCYSKCRDVARTAFTVLMKCARHGEYEVRDWVDRHVSQSSHVVKRFPNLVTSAIALVDEWDSDKIPLYSHFTPFSPAIMQSLNDELRQNYESEDEGYRREAFDKLSVFAPSNVPEAAFQLIEKGIHDEDNIVRYRTALLIVFFIRDKSPWSPQLLQMLIDQCSDENPATRSHALGCIEKWIIPGPNLSMTAWNKLCNESYANGNTLISKLLIDENEDVRRAAFGCYIRTPDTVRLSVQDIQKKLSVGLKDKSLKVRITVVRALKSIASMGEAFADIAWTLLLQCLRGQDQGAREAAAREVIRVARVASIEESSVFDLLRIRFTEDNNVYVRIAALEAMARLVTESEESSGGPLEMIEGAITDEKAEVRHKACTLIVRLHKDFPMVVASPLSLLKGRCEDNHDDVRAEAFEQFLELSLLSPCEEDISEVLSLGQADPFLWIREVAYHYEEIFALSGKARTAYCMQWLLERVVEMNDEAALETMRTIDGGIHDFGHLMLQAAAHYIQSNNEVFSAVTIVDEVLRDVLERDDSRNTRSEAMRLLMKAASRETYVWDSIKKLIQDVPFSVHFEYYLRTRNEDCFRALRKRFLDVAVLFNTIGSSQWTELVLYEDSSEVYIQRSPEEMEILIGFLKSAVGSF